VAEQRPPEARSPEQLSLPDPLAPPKPLEPPEPPGALEAGRRRAQRDDEDEPPTEPLPR
jgi:hypothetical protein